MGRKISEEQFNNIRVWAEEMFKLKPRPTKNAMIWSIQDNFDVGRTTARRALKAKDYADYKNILNKEHPAKKRTFVVKAENINIIQFKPSLWQRIKNKFKRNK